MSGLSLPARCSRCNRTTIVVGTLREDGECRSCKESDRIEAERRRSYRRATEPLDLGDALLPAAAHGYRGDWLEVSRLAPAPERAPVAPVAAVVNTCSCGIAYTAETWAALELRGAKDITEGATVIHEDYRNCTCGSTRMVFTTRLAGEGA